LKKIKIKNNLVNSIVYESLSVVQVEQFLLGISVGFKSPP